MSALESVINEEILKIWSSIEKVITAQFNHFSNFIFHLKPETMKTSQFDDVFSLKFAFLPHKIFKAEEFLISIDKLRER